MRGIHRRRPLVLCVLLLAGPALPSDGDVVINEIHYHPAEDDEGSEFVELLNAGAEPVSLGGWKFSRGITFLFPEGTALEPGGYLVVARSVGTFRRRHPHPGLLVVGDFQGALANGGERIELRNGAGELVESLRWSDQPPHSTRPDGGGPTLERRSPFADSDLPHNWRASLPEWERIEATGTFPASAFALFLKAAGEVIIDDLSLTLEGSEAPFLAEGFEEGPGGFSFGPSHRGSRRETAEVFSGKGALRLVSTGLGTATSARMDIVPPLPAGAPVRVSFRARWASGANSIDFGSPGGLLGPVELLGTPGGPNSVSLETLPPRIHAAYHEPKSPGSADRIALLAVVTHGEEIARVQAEVHDGTGLTVVVLRDDGLSGDGPPADGVWGAMLSPRPHGTFLRYRVAARDRSGREERYPIPGEPTESRACLVNDRAVDSRLPVFEWHLPSGSLEQLERRPTAYQPGTLVFEGEVYDLGIGFDGAPDPSLFARFGAHGFRHRGQNSLGNPKKPWKLKFLKDRLFDRGESERFGGPRRRINFNALWTPKDYLREHLGHRAFEDLGSANCYSEHARIELNGQFHGLYMHLEQPDEDFLDRNGLDGDEGELWKANEGADAKTIYNYEKKTALPAGVEALRELITPLHTLFTDEQKRRFVDERIDVPRFRDYLVATAVISNADHPHKNHYLYHDRATGRWTQTPWDLDLTWGQNFECVSDCAGGLYPPGGTGRDCLRWRNHVLLGTRSHQKCDLKWNLMIDVFLSSEKHNGMFRDRLKEAASEYLTIERLGPVIEDLRERIRPEVALDRARWGSWGNAITWDYGERIEELKGWIGLRQKYLLDSLPPPISSFSCALAGRRALELAWSGEGRWKRFFVRIGPPGEWGTQVASLPGTARSAAIPLEPSVRGEIEVQLSALGQEDLYTPAVSRRVRVPSIPFIRADVTGDGQASLDDAVAILDHLFRGAGLAGCLPAADVDGDGTVRINDPIHLLLYAFRCGPRPAAPFPGCGEGADSGPPCAAHGACP